MSTDAKAPSGTPRESIHGPDQKRTAIKGAATIAALLAAALAGHAYAQDRTARALTARSSIVVAGTVVKVRSSLEPLLAPSRNTVVISISRMYAGAEFAGDQRGHKATVILSRPSANIRIGTNALFFGNPRFIGKTLTIASEGELLAGAAAAQKPAMEADLQAARDRPLRERIAAATSVFIGKVESEQSIAGAFAKAERSPAPPTEHDPEWHVASVRVVDALRGSEKGAVVHVIFPASRDIIWVNSPKLKPGQEALFITHKPDKSDTRLMGAPGVAAFLEKQTAQVASQPSDALPASDYARVRKLMEKGR
jgi:hypothetical protein